MKVIKAINNNVVSALDEGGNEVIIVGKGVGFKAKDTGEVDSSSIEKIFRMDNATETQKLKDLFSGLSLELLRVTNRIIDYAKLHLSKQLNQSVYITLTDHIAFAVDRYKKGMKFRNALTMEVRRFYNEEYQIGLYAVEIIDQEFSIRFSDDEAASIALHIVNAEYDASISETVRMTESIDGIIKIVENRLLMKMQEGTLFFDRFVTHLKFLFQRILKPDLNITVDNDFVTMVKNSYPHEYACSEEIGDYISSRSEHQITDEDKAYLTIHIRRIMLPRNQVHQNMPTDKKE
ncbi:MAG: PRD domain-containing protein [Oscillospiraceae bacterium]